MTELTIYDPAMCCDTGVCGVDADTVLIKFSSDIEWLRKNGVTVQRFNLAQEPLEFISNSLIKSEIEEHGDSCLPLVVLDDKVLSRGAYPAREQLQLWAGIDQTTSNVEDKSTANSCCNGGSC